MCLSWFECRSSPAQVHGRRTQLEEVGLWGWSWWVAELPGFQPKFSASWSRVYPPATTKSQVALPGSPPWAATHEPKSGTFKLLLGISSRQLEKKNNESNVLYCFSCPICFMSLYLFDNCGMPVCLGTKLHIPDLFWRQASTGLNSIQRE